VSWILFIPTVLVVALTTWFLNGFGVRNWERTQGFHWSERARELYPVQVSAAYGLFLAAGCGGIVGFWVSREWLLGPGLFGLGAFIGGLLGCYPTTRRVWPEVQFHKYVASCIKGWAFFLSLVLSIPVLSWAMGWSLDGRAILVGSVYLVVYLWYVTVGWLWVLKRIGGVKAVSPEHDRLVRVHAESEGLVLREVLLLEGAHALAFALPLQQSVLLSPKLFAVMSTEELRSILDHEFAHLKESKSVLAGRIVGALAYAPIGFIGVASKWHGMKGVVACYVAWVGIGLAAKRLARAMEVRADRLAGGGPEGGAVYARALEKIYEVNLAPASGISKNRIHPDLYDRMLAAGVQPDFERPARPDYVNWTVLVWILALFCLLVARAFESASRIQGTLG
jgi:Zn-dependent protease with chaperone function